jgi:hypothetical protein
VDSGSGTALLSSNNIFTGTNAFNTSLPTSTLTPTTSTQLTTKAYVDSGSGTALLSSNNIFTGTNAFNTSLPTSTVTPTASTQLTTKAYVDSGSGTALLSSNNTWTGTNAFTAGISTTTTTYDGDSTVQDSAFTGAAALAGTYTSTNLTINSNGAISAISSGPSAVNLLPLNNTWTGTNVFNTNLPTSILTPTTGTQLTTKTYVDSVASNATNIASVIMQTYNTANTSFGGTFNNFTTTNNTQYADVYIISAGGCSSKGAGFNTGSAVKSGGGAGGGGGVVMYSRIPMGYINLQYRIEPQFVNTYISPQLDTIIWSGTITQNGTTITLVSTTSGAVQVGSWIQLPNTTPNFNYLNSQLYIVSGSGTTWTCLSSQGQTISTATSANGAFNNVGLDRLSYWTGTFTQSGNTITLVSNTTGSISTVGTTNNYMIVNGVSYTIQAITANSGTTLTSNCSQNISTATAGAIYGTPYGTNVSLMYAYLNGCENSYTGYPYIGYTTGGTCGTNGSVNNSTFTYQVGTGGSGGIAVAYVPTNNVFTGGIGNNGTYNDDVTGMTTLFSYGGQCPLLVSNTKTINSVATNLSYAYNAGATIVNEDTSYFPQNVSNCGGVLVVCYSS